MELSLLLLVHLDGINFTHRFPNRSGGGEFAFVVLSLAERLEVSNERV